VGNCPLLGRGPQPGAGECPLLGWGLGAAMGASGRRRRGRPPSAWPVPSHGRGSSSQDVVVEALGEGTPGNPFACVQLLLGEAEALILSVRGRLAKIDAMVPAPQRPRWADAGNDDSDDIEDLYSCSWCWECPPAVPEGAAAGLLIDASAVDLKCELEPPASHEELCAQAGEILLIDAPAGDLKCELEPPALHEELCAQARISLIDASAGDLKCELEQPASHEELCAPVQLMTDVVSPDCKDLVAGHGDEPAITDMDVEACFDELTVSAQESIRSLPPRVLKLLGHFARTHPDMRIHPLFIQRVMGYICEHSMNYVCKHLTHQHCAALNESAWSSYPHFQHVALPA